MDDFQRFERVRHINPPVLRSDARRLLDALGVVSQRETLREIWAFSPFRGETRPSFHIRKQDLAWYDFGEGRGGGPIRLISRVLKISMSEAWRWAAETGMHNTIGSRQTRIHRPLKKRQEPNPPLTGYPIPRSRLNPHHPLIRQRGISPATCRALGFGFLPATFGGPMAGRVVFEIRGVREEGGRIQSLLLAHVGRAVKNDSTCKWRITRGFKRTIELYNQDRVLLDPAARAQTSAHGLVLVEGCLDVAKLHEAGIFNSLATLSAHLSEGQIQKLRYITKRIAVPLVRIWFDRDKAGMKGTETAVELLRNAGFTAVGSFDWHARFESPCPIPKSIPDTLNDPCDFSIEQLRFLRSRSLL